MSDPADQTTPPAAGSASPVPPAPAWAAPSAPPFGTPSAPPAPAPGYALPAGYAPPAGYGAPAMYAAPAPGYAPARPAGRGLGIVAFVVALVATAGSALAVAAAAFGIGLGTGREIAMRPLAADFDWAILTPVRDWVLLAETAFWVGTALGVWALIQGIVALVKDRGRGWAIAAVVTAAVGPVVFFVVLGTFLEAGYTAGSGVGG